MSSNGLPSGVRQRARQPVGTFVTELMIPLSSASVAAQGEMSQRAARRSSRSGSTVAVGAICGRGADRLQESAPCHVAVPFVPQGDGPTVFFGSAAALAQPESGGEESPRPEQLNKATELRFYRLGMIRSSAREVLGHSDRGSDDRLADRCGPWSNGIESLDLVDADPAVVQVRPGFAGPASGERHP